MEIVYGFLVMLIALAVGLLTKLSGVRKSTLNDQKLIDHLLATIKDKNDLIRIKDSQIAALVDTTKSGRRRNVQKET